MNLLLKRSYLENCTIGVLFYQGSKVCNTVEKPWNSNKPFKSCIPAGKYKIYRHHSEKYPNTFALVNHDLGIGQHKGDSLRYGCLIHVANFPDEVEGCIGPGLDLHPSTWGVSQSRKAMDVLNKLINLESEDCEIEII
jgi:hypothetical protein